MYKLRVISGKHKGKYVGNFSGWHILTRPYVKCLDKAANYYSFEAAWVTTWYLHWGVLVVPERHGHCWSSDDYDYANNLGLRLFKFSDQVLTNTIMETIREGPLEPLIQCTTNIPKFAKKCPWHWLHRSLIANRKKFL